MDEQNRPVIKKELAAEPLSARTELDLIRTDSFGIERQVHQKSVAPAGSQHDYYGLMIFWLHRLVVRMNVPSLALALAPERQV